MMELVRQRRRLSEPEAAYYALQLIDGMRYMHTHNVIHRDLKLGNLFLSRCVCVCVCVMCMCAYGYV